MWTHEARPDEFRLLAPLHVLWPFWLSVSPTALPFLLLLPLFLFLSSPSPVFILHPQPVLTFALKIYLISKTPLPPSSYSLFVSGNISSSSLLY